MPAPRTFDFVGQPGAVPPAPCEPIDTSAVSGSRARPSHQSALSKPDSQVTARPSAARRSRPLSQSRAKRFLARGGGPLVVLSLLTAAGARFLHDPGADSTTSVFDTDRAPNDVSTASVDPVAAARSAAEARPDDIAGWQRLGTLSLQRAIRSSDPVDYQVAREAFDRADRLLPDDPTTITGRATLELSLHQFDEAYALATRAVAARPRDTAALAALVDAEVELGRYNEAAVHTQQLLDARPAVAALSRASYQRELRGDIDGALVAMVQAEGAAGGVAAPEAGDRNELATVVALQGDIRWAAGDLVAAGDRYRDALELAGGLPIADIGLARVDAATGRTQDAIDRLKTLLGRAPYLPAATLLADLEAAYGRTGSGADLVAAIATLQRAAGAVVDLELAVHLADLGTPDVALARTAYASRPSVYGADALAWSLLRSGDAVGALPLTVEALQLGTADPMLRFHAAAVFAAVGQRDRAARELERVAASNPRFSVRLRPEIERLATDLGIALRPIPTATADEPRPAGAR